MKVYFFFSFFLKWKREKREKERGKRVVSSTCTSKTSRRLYDIVCRRSQFSSCCANLHSRSRRAGAEAGNWKKEKAMGTQQKKNPNQLELNPNWANLQQVLLSTLLFLFVRLELLSIIFILFRVLQRLNSHSSKPSRRSKDSESESPKSILGKKCYKCTNKMQFLFSKEFSFEDVHRSKQIVFAFSEARKIIAMLQFH